MKKVVILILVSMLLNSCKRDAAIPATNKVLPSINGTWQLIQITGGFGGGGTPVAPNNNVITFNENGSFIGSIQQLITDQGGTYAVTPNNDPSYSFEYKLSFNQSQDDYFLKISHDTLNLACDCNDGFGFVFLKK
jgi:hypothetical protein